MSKMSRSPYTDVTKHSTMAVPDKRKTTENFENRQFRMKLILAGPPSLAPSYFCRPKMILIHDMYYDT